MLLCIACFAFSGQQELRAEGKKEHTKELFVSEAELYSSGLSYIRKEDYEKALSCFNELCKKNPRYSRTCYYIGLCNLNLKRWDGARAALNQCISIKSDDAEAYNLLGTTYCMQEQYQEAVEAFKQAVRIKPDFTKAHHNLGLAYIILGDKGLAFEEYKALKDLSKDLASDLFNKIYK
ncbi:MAG TPA: tetratricopeptide repeat protein [Candidatus Brocadiaceae bacterium]